MDQNHNKGIQGDAINQRKDDGNIRILLHNPGGIGFMMGQRNRESYKMDKLIKVYCRETSGHSGIDRYALNLGKKQERIRSPTILQEK